MTTENGLYSRSIVFLIMFILAVTLNGCGGGGSGSSGGGGMGFGSGVAADSAPFTGSAAVSTTTNANTFTCSGKIATPQRNDMGVITDTVRITVTKGGRLEVPVVEVPVAADGSYSATVETKATGIYTYTAELMRVMLGSVTRTPIATVAGNVELGKTVDVPRDNTSRASVAASVTVSAPSYYGADFAILRGTLSNHGGKPWRVYHEYTVAGGSAQKTDETTIEAGSHDPFTFGRWVEFDYNDQGKEVHDRFHAINPDGGKLTADVSFRLKTFQEIKDAEALDALTQVQTESRNLSMVLTAAAGSSHVLVKEEINLHRTYVLIALDYVEDVSSEGLTTSTTIAEAMVEVLKPADDSPLKKVEQYFDHALKQKIEAPNMAVLPVGFLDYCAGIDNPPATGSSKVGGEGKVYGLENRTKPAKTTLADLLAQVPRPAKWDGNIEAAALRSLASSVATSATASTATSATPTPTTTEGSVFQRELFTAMIKKTYADEEKLDLSLENNGGTQFVWSFIQQSYQAIQMEKSEWLTWGLAHGSAAPFLTSGDLDELEFLQASVGSASARARTSDASSVSWFCGKATELWTNYTVFSRLYDGAGAKMRLADVAAHFKTLKATRAKTAK